MFPRENKKNAFPPKPKITFSQNQKNCVFRQNKKKTHFPAKSEQSCFPQKSKSCFPANTKKWIFRKNLKNSFSAENHILLPENHIFPPKPESVISRKKLKNSFSRQHTKLCFQKKLCFLLKPKFHFFLKNWKFYFSRKKPENLILK